MLAAGMVGVLLLFWMWIIPGILLTFSGMLALWDSNQNRGDNQKDLIQ